MGYNTQVELSKDQKQMKNLVLKSKLGYETYRFKAESISGIYIKKNVLKIFLEGGQVMELYNWPANEDDEWVNWQEFVDDLNQLLEE
jgi:hypothetical protein